jgi:hypothetical protein
VTFVQKLIKREQINEKRFSVRLLVSNIIIRRLSYFDFMK